MTRINRIVLILTVLGLLTPGLSEIAYSQNRTSDGDSAKSFVIAGNVGLPGVVMTGLPGNVMTGPQGDYHTQVPYGWSGTVTPTREGYRFEPASKVYQQFIAPLPNQDYRCEPLVFTISGDASVRGVMIQGLPGTPITDENGVYAVTVPYGWAGAVTPRKPGHSFNPPRREYVKVAGNLDRQNYKAEVAMVTISDTLFVGNEPIPGVIVSAEPGGYEAVTDAHGRYSLQVPHGWSGRLVLEKPGIEFEPSGIIFSNVPSDIINGRPVPSAGRQSITRPRSAMEAYPRALVPGTADDVLVIPTREVAPPQFAETTEDMRVMLHILREKLSEPRTILGVLYDYGDFFGRGSRGAKAIYLQGYGALFLLEVDFPFSFPQEPPAGNGQEQTVPADPIWERARQNLYAPRNPAGYGSRGRPGETREMDFNQFKEDLLQTLKHAANIRNVEPNESVILTVTARKESGGWPAPASAGGAYGGGMGGYGGGMMGGMGSYGGGGGMWFEGSSYSTSGNSFGPAGGSTHADSATRSSGSTAGRGGPRPVQPAAAPGPSATVLTIQARKADIDAFGQGDLSFEQFQQRIRTFTY